MSAVLDSFRATIGDVPVITDGTLVQRKSRDFYWYSPVLKAKLEGLGADIVVTPRDEADIVAVVKACYALDLPLTVRGAGTGNYGQCMPLRRGVVLETTALDKIIWTRPGRVRTQAGLRMDVLENRCREAVGGELRLYPSTWKTATIGGFIGGGSSGIGAVTWGLLRDPGNVVAARVITMEAEPRTLELRGAAINQVNHAYGATGIITELELPLAPVVKWVDVAVAVPGFSDAVALGQRFSEQPGIQKRLCALIAAPVAQDYFGRLGDLTPAGAHLLLWMVAAEDVEAAEQLVAAVPGARVIHAKPTLDSDLPPLAEFSWNHTTLRAIRKQPDITYLQVLFAGPGRIGLIEESFRQFGDEVPVHLEWVHFGDHVGCFGLQLLRYTTQARLNEIMDWFEARGCPVFDPHAYTLEEGGMKEIDPVQLAFKRQTDPKGLLNPGKMLAWEQPDFRGRKPVSFMYAAEKASA
jgi:FAD/FMN-containing dehydrogenase